VPHHHHDPLDPRDPLAPAFYFTFIADDNGRPSRRGRSGDMHGCGCVALMLIAVILLIIGGLTK